MGGGVTYTFTSIRTETLYTNGDISSPTSANLPKIKIVENNETKYVPLLPFDGTKNASAFSVSQTASYSSSLTSIANNILAIAEPASVTIDDVEYWGYKNAKYLYGRMGKSSSVTLPAFTAKACTVKVVKYVASDNNVGVYTYTTSDTQVQSAAGGSSGSSFDSTYYYPYQYVMFNIPKYENDIILSISIEYPEE